MRSYSNLPESRIGRSMMHAAEAALSPLAPECDSLSLRRRVSFARGLAHMLDSLVRVSRRVERGHFDANVLGTFYDIPDTCDRQRSRRTARSPPHSTTDRRDEALACERHVPRLLGSPRAMRRRPVTAEPRRDRPTLPTTLTHAAHRRWRAPARSATVDGSEPDGYGPFGSASRPPETAPG